MPQSSRTRTRPVASTSLNENWSFKVVTSQCPLVTDSDSSISLRAFQLGQDILQEMLEQDRTQLQKNRARWLHVNAAPVPRVQTLRSNRGTCS